ncbi:MAG TPA: alpha/beta hydrolase [Acidimicrobiales bacterium]|nr:alpha/beta hydrolase [Acidimicrobiales bacterium]
MPIAVNGGVEIYYESFGNPADQTLLLINGLGSQCINFPEEWCEKFAAHGYQVVRFDNRDTGLSTKLDGIEYTLADMAADAVSVLDALGVARAHVMGLSMGGMIVQRLAIDRPDRLLSMTSVMSRTGENDHGQTAPAALAILLSRPAKSRQEYIDNHVKALGVYGSKPEWIDEDDARARAAAAYDRCFCPEGLRRQIAAVMADGSRAEALPRVAVPALVMHGSRDTLIDPSGGRRTAELIPGARFVEIDGMGHDYPQAVWDLWVATWGDFVQGIAA